ncbi:hypothetical protein G6F64_014227 [Rhizopus arrhizus]|uniref:Uncharacterized protein n=1 Tax=Rhizopus oryzae TaxID=64495 RepID=A0A9P6WTT2_RHIOR|nr:hypothetical protein G6F64_014227 [Rhizopus arrhizus]
MHADTPVPTKVGTYRAISAPERTATGSTRRSGPRPSDRCRRAGRTAALPRARPSRPAGRRCGRSARAPGNSAGSRC